MACSAPVGCGLVAMALVAPRALASADSLRGAARALAPAPAVDPCCSGLLGSTGYRAYGSCSYFYQCVNGGVWGGAHALQRCPGDLLWNEEANSCDFKENFDCGSEHCDMSVSLDPTPAPALPAQTPAPTVDPCCAGSSKRYRAYGSCTYYYQCVGGAVQGRPIPCPANQLWNEESDTCDYKENVTCGQEHCTMSVSLPPTPVPTTSAPTPAPTVDPCCAETPDAYRAYNSCTQFYQCVDGGVVQSGMLGLQSCPAGLYFNEAKSVCDYDINVECHAPVCVMTRDGNSPVPSTPAPPQTTTDPWARCAGDYTGKWAICGFADNGEDCEFYVFTGSDKEPGTCNAWCTEQGLECISARDNTPWPQVSCVADTRGVAEWNKGKAPCDWEFYDQLCTCA